MDTYVTNAKIDILILNFMHIKVKFPSNTQTFYLNSIICTYN